MAPLFIDFEASSLEGGSFPIEVGWCTESGQGQAYLIAPCPYWTTWSPASERVHGISRKVLSARGQPAADVARKTHAACTRDGVAVYSDAPVFDQNWLGLLLGEGGFKAFPRILDVTRLFVDECKVMYSANKEVPNTAAWHRENGRIADRISFIIGSAEEAHEGPRAHRAQADAERLWRMWTDTRARVAAECRVTGACPAVRPTAGETP